MRWVIFSLLSLVLAGCNWASLPSFSHEGGPCETDRNCYAGLVCVEQVCVVLPGDQDEMESDLDADIDELVDVVDNPEESQDQGEEVDDVELTDQEEQIPAGPELCGAGFGSATVGFEGGRGGAAWMDSMSGFFVKE